SVEAFRYLVRQNDPERLRNWLARRPPEEKAFLRTSLMEANSSFDKWQAGYALTVLRRSRSMATSGRWSAGIAGLDWSAAPRSPASLVKQGQRNSKLFSDCLEAARHCDDFDALCDVARTRNREFLPPLEDEEVMRTAASAWKYETEGRNYIGGMRA